MFAYKIKFDIGFIILHITMDSLPPEIQANIIKYADVPIDTYLYYKKTVGALPKRLCIPHETRSLLEKIYEERSKNAAFYKSAACRYVMSSFCKDFDSERSIEIMIGEDADTHQIKIAFRARKTTYQDPQWPEMFIIRKTICDVHTGEYTSDWLQDSDSD